MKLQVERIQQLHQEVRAALEQDEFAVLEPAMLELMSRVDALVATAGAEGLSLEEEATFSMLNDATSQLVKIVALKLKITSTELKKAHEARRATEEYSIKPSKQRSHLTTGMDVLG